MRECHGIEAEGFGTLLSRPLFAGGRLPASRNNPLLHGLFLSPFQFRLAAEWRDGMRSVWDQGVLCSLSISFCSRHKISGSWTWLGVNLNHKESSSARGMMVLTLYSSRDRFLGWDEKDLEFVVTRTPQDPDQNTRPRKDSNHIASYFVTSPSIFATSGRTKVASINCQQCGLM